MWVYELDQSGEGSFSSPNKVTNDANALKVNDLNNYDQDEPFLLKFGPGSLDKFQPKSPRCFSGEDLPKNFKFGKIHVYYALICWDGFISFNDYESADAISRSMYKYNRDSQVIAPLLYGYRYQTNRFFDYSCLWFDNRVYQTNRYFRDFCFDLASRNLYEPTQKSNIREDDEDSKIRFGMDTTKYVNLAGNMFTREITSIQDLDVINQLISTKIPSFHATSGYVVTWYKIGRPDAQSSFNSFQSITACGDNKDCVVINDYYEMEWGSGSPEIGAESGSFEMTNLFLF